MTPGLRLYDVARGSFHNLYRISAVEDFAGAQMLHPVPVLVFAGIVRTVAAAIPRLDADEGRVLARWRPQSQHGSIEAQGEDGLPVDVIQRHFAHLSVLQDKGVDVERMCVEGQESIRQFQGITGVGVYATLLGDADIVQAFSTVEAEESSARVVGCVVGEVEGRVRPYLKIQVVSGGVRHLPEHVDAPSAQAIAYLKYEGEGIFPAGFLGVGQAVAQLVGRLQHQFKVHVAGKAVLGERVCLPAYAVLPLPDGAYDGEQYRGMTLPVSGVCLPKILMAIADDAGQLGPMRGHLECQFVVG